MLLGGTDKLVNSEGFLLDERDNIVRLLNRKRLARAVGSCVGNNIGFEKENPSLHVGLRHCYFERGHIFFVALSSYSGTDGAAIVLVVSFLLGVRVSNLAVVWFVALLFLEGLSTVSIGIRIFVLAAFWGALVVPWLLLAVALLFSWCTYVVFLVMRWSFSSRTLTAVLFSFFTVVSYCEWEEMVRLRWVCRIRINTDISFLHAARCVSFMPSCSVSLALSKNISHYLYLPPTLRSRPTCWDETPWCWFIFTAACILCLAINTQYMINETSR